MQAVLVEHHLRRASDFLDGARLLNTDDSLLNSPALLAVHSALSYSDALRVGLGSERLKADDHRKAVDELAKLIPGTLVPDRTGLRQLADLVAQKSPISYGSKRIALNDLKSLTTRAERFAVWANNVGKVMKVEGWRHDNV